MKQFPLIREYMATELVSLSPETEINRAMVILMEAHISGAPVLDDAGRLVGVLSKKDCLKAALNDAYYQEWGGAVADYMSRDVQTLDANIDIVKAAELFLASPFRRFPVTEGGQVVGQVSRADILRGLIDQWD